MKTNKKEEFNRLSFYPEAKAISIRDKVRDSSIVRGVHYSHKENLPNLNGDFYGSGVKGAEARRLIGYPDFLKKRIYFYIADENGALPKPEPYLGKHVYYQTFDNILRDEKRLRELYCEANGIHSEFEIAIVEAGYDGYAVNSNNMMVLLNVDNVPVIALPARPAKIIAARLKTDKYLPIPLKPSK